MNGEVFSPIDFSAKVERFYGLRMHPYVAEDWIPRFEEAGLVEKISGDHYSQTYRCRSGAFAVPVQAGPAVSEIVSELIAHTASRLREHGSQLNEDEIEAGIIKRLYKPEFIALLSRPQKVFSDTSTLTLSAAPSDETAVDSESLIDFILADRLLTLSRENRPQFDAIADIAGGALVSEVVLALRSPPIRGQTAQGIEVFLDSPLIIDFLDLSDKQQHQYAKLLIDDLKAMGVYLRTFEHNVDEIKAILDATMRAYRDVKVATGSVANRLRSDPLAASRAQMIRQNTIKHLSDLGCVDGIPAMHF